MKAISIKQPYAHLIASGRKTVELRTWSTNHRGPVLICASAKPANFDLDEECLVGGHATCVVEVVSVERMNKTHWRSACWTGEVYEDGIFGFMPLFAWTFANPRAVKPFPVKGVRKFSTVDDGLIQFLPPTTCMHAREDYDLPDEVQVDNTGSRLTSHMKQLVAFKQRLYSQHPGEEDLHRKNTRRRRRIALQDGDFSNYLLTYEKHVRIRRFVKMIPRMSSEQYWKTLADLWTNVEVIQPDMRTWLSLLESSKSHREFLMTPEEHEALTKLPDEVEIWRGCGDKIGSSGLSWTL